MPIKRFIEAGQQWEARCLYYKGQDKRCDQDCQTELKNNSDSISQLEQQLQQLNLIINNNESQIRACYGETYERKLFDVLDSRVSPFGISTDKSDKSLEAEREINALKNNLLRQKQCEQQIQNLKNQIPQIEAVYQARKTSIRDDFTKEKEVFVQKITAEYDRLSAGCISAYDATSVPCANTSMPSKTVILGNQHADVPQLKNIIAGGSLSIPYEVDVKNGGNFIININQQDLYSGDLEKTVVGMLIKYIESFPATKMHLGVFSSMLPSMNFLNSLYRAMKNKKCTLLDEGVSSRGKIGELLDKIATYVVSPEDKIIDQGCGDLYELYDQIPDSDPFQIILLYNALSDINEENLLKIYSYISGYHKYGVRFIIVEDFASINKKSNIGFSQALENIKKSCTLIDYNHGNSIINGVYTDLISIADDFDSIKLIFYCQNYLAQKSTAPYVTYENIGFGVEAKDESNYESISIPIGVSGSNVCSISFTSISNQKNRIPLANLILGQSGTGKTKLIDAMIYNAAIKYSPQDVVFYLLDFKDGSMSADYLIEAHKIPHVKFISAKNDAEEAGFILDNIIAENAARVKKFQALATQLNTKIDNIAIYNRIIDERKLNLPKMPRLIMAIDECQTLFDSDTLAAKTQDIIRKGRSQGIHLVLATQAMTSNMRKVVRFIDGLYVFEAVMEDIQAVLDKPFHSRVNKEVPKGSYQAFASNDAGKTCVKFKVAFYGDGNLGRYAQMVRDKWSNEPCNILVIGENSKLVLRAADCESLFNETKGFCVPLGENYQNRRPEYFDIGSAGYASTLLVGSSEDIACGINTSIVLSAKFNGIPTYAIDVSRTQALAKIKKTCFADDTSISVGSGKDYRDTLIKVYQIYQKRMQERNNDPTKEFSPIAFIVNGAHEVTDYCDNLVYDGVEAQNDEMDVQKPSAGLLHTSFLSFKGSRQSSCNEQKTIEKKKYKILARTTLIELIEKGAKLGIYVSLWFDKNEVSIERKNLRDSCDIKIIFPVFKSQKESYLDSSFKEKMLSRVNQNMAFIEHSSEGGIRTFKRLRIYQYNLDDPEMINFIKNFNIK